MASKSDRATVILELQQSMYGHVNHQTLFYSFCRDLKALTRRKNGQFRRTISVKALLDLEADYALAESRMMDRKPAAAPSGREE